MVENLSTCKEEVEIRWKEQVKKNPTKITEYLKNIYKGDKKEVSKLV